MQDTLRDLLLRACTALIDTPEAVSIASEATEDGATLYTITVADGVAGQLIGKEGRIANALRTLLMSASRRECRSQRSLLRIISVSEAAG